MQSARDNYEKTFKNSWEWKKHTFAALFRTYGGARRVVSVGDGLDERKALHEMGRKYGLASASVKVHVWTCVCVCVCAHTAHVYQRTYSDTHALTHTPDLYPPSSRSS